ncbi:hypothetical protein CUMW_202840 [Citrus unshiu]|uniref:NB-ARC domain-containing protein n=1 Tax=Citrus unshiu TaxID=55188 RepID=A0A2H5Q7I5_CITUN|nr:hypothetical protein CUMW_202840 [Citrus unshiu]
MGALPLCHLVLGGLIISKEATYSEWAQISAECSMAAESKSSKMYGHLELSYQDLPYYLKPCFLYIGLFPEDFEMLLEKYCRSVTFT